MGHVHAANLARHVPGASLEALADTFPGRAAAAADALGVPRSYEHSSLMFQDGGLDAVVVATPTDTHAGIIAAAAQAGLHVFSEKPLARTLADARDALAAVRDAGVSMMIAFNRRFDPAVRAVADFVHSGRSGDLLTVHIVARDPIHDFGPLQPGDLFLETAIHDIDTACWLAGAPVESVQAFGGARGGLDDPDFALTVIRYANGVVATLDNNWLAAHGYDQRLEVCGTGGMAYTENERLHSAAIALSAGETLAPPQAFFPERYRTSYVEEMAAFVASLRDGVPPPVTGEDALTALAVALAAYRSYREGRALTSSEIGA
jgi:myo-inositol 2-dehydrogenase/D-chiro-inositol 1-dehydrogenase